MILPDLAAEVNPFIGTTNGGNFYQGATMPVGMVAFSPEATPLPGRSFPITAPGGSEWRANGIRGFALTHLSGTGCTGASGDVPIMPVTMPVERPPSSVAHGPGHASLLDPPQESARPGAYQPTLDHPDQDQVGTTTRNAVTPSQTS